MCVCVAVASGICSYGTSIRSSDSIFNVVVHKSSYFSTLYVLCWWCKMNLEIIKNVSWFLCLDVVKRLQWSRGSVLAFGTQVRGFAPGRIRWIFRAKKSSARLPSFGGEVKPSVPCRSFTACKRSLNVTWKSAFMPNYRTFLAHSFTFRRWALSRGDTLGDAWWRKLERLTGIAQ